MADEHSREPPKETDTMTELTGLTQEQVNRIIWHIRGAVVFIVIQLGFMAFYLGNVIRHSCDR